MRKVFKDSRRDLGRVGRGVFSPAQVAEVKALACELPAEQGVPLSRWSSAQREVLAPRRMTSAKSVNELRKATTYVADR